MKIGIRADASNKIGSGHIMRCLALAFELAKQNTDITFYCYQLPDPLLAKITAAGFDVIMLQTTNGSFDQNYDARQTLKTIGAKPLDILIVDHYALDIVWETSLNVATKTMVVIDDCVNRPHNCDVLIDQTLGRTIEEYRDLAPKDCKILVGTDYALLRSEFEQHRKTINFDTKSYGLKRILVSLGGSDTSKALAEIAAHLKYIFAKQDIEITIISQSADIRDDNSDTKQTHPTLNYVPHLENMAQRMLEADLIIGAAGTSTWERCCLGVPSYMFVIADNQKEISEQVHKAGAAIAIMKVDQLFTDELAPGSPTLVSALREMSKKAYDLVDGKGARRVSNILFAEAGYD